jgi:hypothetical protein
MIFLTTTAITVDEELQNRCIMLTVDEQREQTRAIHQMQRSRKTLAGLVAGDERRRLMALHQDAQRLLRPLAVVNPWAERLTFPDHRTRLRRDHAKYLTLIESVALLHQYQREVRTVTHRGQPLTYIEATLSDIEWANRLAHHCLGRSLDELHAPTRALLRVIVRFVAERAATKAIDRTDVRFSRREIREFAGWSEAQVRLHLETLTSMEYVVAHRGGRGQTFVYELLFDGSADDGTPCLPGLIDVAALRAEQSGTGYDPNFAEKSGHFADASRPVRGDFVAGSQREEITRPRSEIPSSLAALAAKKKNFSTDTDTGVRESSPLDRNHTEDDEPPAAAAVAV